MFEKISVYFILLQTRRGHAISKYVCHAKPAFMLHAKHVQDVRHNSHTRTDWSRREINLQLRKRSGRKELRKTAMALMC